MIGKIIKYLLISIGCIALLGLAAGLFIQLRGIPSYEVKKMEYKAEPTPERLERGKKLALLLCAGCHLNPATGSLTGKQMLDAPKEFGTIYSQNITNDTTYGIGSWTDSEILYLLRTGIKRNGTYAPPYMAKLPHMADEDLSSIISFLRSDDPLVKASNTIDYPCEPTFLTKFLCTMVFKPIPMPDHKIELPDTNNATELGKYLAFNLECFSCHSADFKTNDFEHPEKSVGFFGGGNKPLNTEGQVMLTQNLTPDTETGIGGMSEEAFVNALKNGIKEGQPALRYPMRPFIQLSDQEAKAIYAYLRTIPPIKNKVPRSPFD